MPIVAAAAIPAALELGSLRRDTERCLDALPAFDVAVLLAGGSEPLLHDVARASIAPQGGAARSIEVAVDIRLLTAIARRGQAPRVQSRDVTGGLGVLAFHLDGARPGCRMLPMTVPQRASADVLDGIAIGLDAAVADVDERVAIIAAGDLAGALGQHVADDGIARRWDEMAAAAVTGSDLSAVALLGPAVATEVGAAGWAPLTVLLRLVARAGLHITSSTYELVGDAGRIVAATMPFAEDEG